MNASIVGILYVVASPIGNLQDMSYRAVDILKRSDLIVAEDTRHSKVLLSHYDIRTPVKSLHEHNEKEEAKGIVQLLLKGQTVSLVSDAGTPLISDPGYRLVVEARGAGVPVSPIPGPCAAIAALSVSGLATNQFIFEGFLPMKTTARRKQVEQLRDESRTLIFYEAPHRILDTLQDMQTIFGPERQAVLARELTKIYETVHGGSLKALLAWVESDKNQQRGEMVIIVQGAGSAAEKRTHLSAEQVLHILLKELPRNQAVKLTCEITGEKRNKLYKMGLSEPRP